MSKVITKEKTYKLQYSIGDLVYLKTDSEQLQRIITGFSIGVAGVEYEVACGVDISIHIDLELSSERDIIKATS